MLSPNYASSVSVPSPDVISLSTPLARKASYLVSIGPQATAHADALGQLL